MARFAEHAPKLLGRPYWGTYDNAAGQKSMVLLRAIHDTANQQLIGSLFLGVRPSHFGAIVDADLGTGSAMYVLDADAGKIVIDPLGHGAAGALAAKLRGSLARNARSGVVADSGGAQKSRYLAAYAQVTDTSWFVIGAIPLGDLSAEARSVRDTNVLIGLAALLAALALALALMLARSVSTPLAALAHAMRETGSGNYARRVTAQGNDEMTALARQFNDMAGKLEQHQLRLEQHHLQLEQRSGELAAANARLAAKSATDKLTGIANRRRFDEVLAGELARAARVGVPVALLMLDVDCFKYYNEAYGHQQGDDCLRRIGGLLQSHARRAGDFAARFGGAQFVLIAFDTDSAGALALGEAIRAALEALQLAHARSPLGRVTASIGVVAMVPNETSSATAMLRLADQAMVRAKQQGRN